MTDQNGVTFSFTVTAPILTRLRVKGAILTYCLQHGLRCKVKQEDGTLETTYIFTITGSTAKTNQAAIDIQAWLEDNSTKEERAQR